VINTWSNILSLPNLLQCLMDIQQHINDLHDLQMCRLRNLHRAAWLLSGHLCHLVPDLLDTYRHNSRHREIACLYQDTLGRNLAQAYIPCLLGKMQYTHGLYGQRTHPKHNQQARPQLCRNKAHRSYQLLCHQLCSWVLCLQGSCPHNQYHRGTASFRTGLTLHPAVANTPWRIYSG